MSRSDLSSTLSRISHIASSTISLGTRAIDLRITLRTRRIPEVTLTILSRTSSEHVCRSSYVGAHIVLKQALNRQIVVLEFTQHSPAPFLLSVLLLFFVNFLFIRHFLYDELIQRPHTVAYEVALKFAMVTM
jgi:hypothetical protein